jgi:ABC-type Fe3+ transport system substrate-binding protein
VSRFPLLRALARAAAVAVIAVPALHAGLASAEDLPKSTQAFLAQLKLSPDIMSGLDKELAVPQSWIDGAKKNPTVRIGGAEEPPLHAQAIKPFLERYPFIKVEYQRGSANERVVRPLLAYREGRYLLDVVRSMNGSLGEFIRLNAAEDLTMLPTYDSVLPGAHDKNGIAIGFRARPYCMSYNPELIPRDKLPKTWADLPNSPLLGNGRVGAVMLPHLWFMPLWGKYGEDWAVKYLDDFFVKLKPQIRREGINAAISLVGAGENYISLPAYPERVKEVADKGAPVSWYCPDMVPLELPKLAIMRGSPNIDAANLYVNWLLSKEGQIAQLAVFTTMPVHKDLQLPQFYLYPEEMKDKEFISYDDQPTIDRFLEMWNKYAAGGSARP